MLSDPEYELRYMTYNDKNGKFENSSSLFQVDNTSGGVNCLALRLLAKMILAGNVQLYKFNTAIQYQWGQTNLTKYEDVKSLTTNSELKQKKFDESGNTTNEDATPYEALQDGYIVKKNQNLQKFHPVPLLQNTWRQKHSR